MRQVRRAGPATVVTALAGMCVLAGCANSHGAADAHSRTSSTSATTTSATAITSPVESAEVTTVRSVKCPARVPNPVAPSATR